MENRFGPPTRLLPQLARLRNHSTDEWVLFSAHLHYPTWAVFLTIHWCKSLTWSNEECSRRSFRVLNFFGTFRSPCSLNSLANRGGFDSQQNAEHYMQFSNGKTIVNFLVTVDGES
jgi:hypothetical protein